MQENFRNTARFIVINKKNEILIVKMGEVWGIPGGGIDFGESIEKALERESLEELGIKAMADKIIFIQDYMAMRKGIFTHFFEYFWIIKNNDDYDNILETYKNSSHAFELSEIKFSKIEDLPETFLPKVLPRIIKKYLKDKDNYTCEYVTQI